MDIVEINRILDEILAERERQEHLKASGKFDYTCADLEPSAGAKTAILGEEYGEVCRAVCEEDNDQLREELIQVAAVAVAWVQSLDDGRRITEITELEERTEP